MSDIHGVGASDNGPALSHVLVRQLSWPALALLVIVYILSIAIVAVPFLVAPSSEVAQVAIAIARGNGVVRLVALIILVPAIGTLALLDKVNGSAAIAALSAIAGYCFGSTSASP
jgi:ABC-type transport system involved in cytochrome c biogenesis permease subunit